MLVVGAGAAGAAAAIEAARLGARVLLVDENPVDGALIGLDVPLYFGGRTPALPERRAPHVEQVLAPPPRWQRPIEAGVDVALGTAAWGLFVPGPALRRLPGPVVGLADASARLDAAASTG